MWCAVKNCGNNNKAKACNLSFFSFPSDAALQKKWLIFCGREMNVKGSNICMEHFTADDFENSLEYEMGFTKKRFLKKGAVPSIKKKTAAIDAVSQQRANRVQKRENKKTVEMLLKEHDIGPVLDDCKAVKRNFELVIVDEEVPEAEIEEISAPSEDSAEDNIPQSKKCDENDEIESLKVELECLRKENKDLKKAQKKLAAKLNDATGKAKKAAKMNEYNLDFMNTRLSQLNDDLSNLEQKLLIILNKEIVDNAKSRKQKFIPKKIKISK